MRFPHQRQEGWLLVSYFCKLGKPARQGCGACKHSLVLFTGGVALHRTHLTKTGVPCSLNENLPELC